VDMGMAPGHHILQASWLPHPHIFLLLVKPANLGIEPGKEQMPNHSTNFHSLTSMLNAERNVQAFKLHSTVHMCT
jgi:hypothetical protein